jgi:hypothetical protein
MHGSCHDSLESLNLTVAAMEALTPARAVRLAHGILLQLGAVEMARNARGDSVYLRMPGRDADLRISNHARTAGRRRHCPGVVHSLVFREPKSERQVRAMAKEALDTYLRRSEPGPDAGIG